MFALSLHVEGALLSSELFQIADCKSANRHIKPNKQVSMLTMKDIARELGISVATVSRALADSPRISESRR